MNFKPNKHELYILNREKERKRLMKKDSIVIMQPSTKRPTKEKVTTLSEYIWKLKDQKTPFSIKWSVKAKAYAFSSGGKRCDLCITEKMVILLSDPRYSLNQRSKMPSQKAVLSEGIQ